MSFESDRKKQDLERTSSILHQQVKRLRQELTIALLPVFLASIYLGGRAGMLILSFGGVVCYIMDLLCTVEGTIISLSLTFFVYNCSLFWAMRHILSSSYLNFAVIIVVTSAIGLIYLSSLLHFSTIFQEFHLSVLFTLQILFVCTPLICSTFLATYICSEVPEFDLITTFSIIYMLYVYFLCRPRLVPLKHIKPIAPSGGNESKVKPITHKQVIFIPSLIMRYLYIFPVVVAPIVYYALHYNILYTSYYSQPTIFEILQQTLETIILMYFCYYRHQVIIARSTDPSSGDRLRSFGIVMVILLFMYFHLIIANHPVLAQLQKLHDIPEPYPFILLNVIIFSIFILILFKLQPDYRSDLDLAMMNHQQSSTFNKSIYSNVFIAVIACAVGVLLGLDISRLVVISLGSAALHEFLFNLSWNSAAKGVLGIISSTSLWLVFMTFSKNTIYYLQFNFAWLVDFTMQQFCTSVSILMVAAITLPAFIDYSLPSTPNEEEGLLLPRSSTEKATAKDWSMFSIGSITLSVSNAAMELVLLDQLWQSVDADVENVYPTYFAVATATVWCYVAFCLMERQVISWSSVLIIWVTHGSKILRVADFSSSQAITIGSFLLCNILPVARQIELYFQHEHELDMFYRPSDEIRSFYYQTTSKTPIWELVLYFIFNCICCVFGGPVISKMLITLILDKPSTTLQDIAISLALFFIFVSSMLFIYYRRAKMLRSATVACSILSIVFALESVGTIGNFFASFLYLDKSSVVGRDEIETEHPGVYIALSTLLTVAAWMKYVSLQNVLSCCIYSVIFGFISSKAMITWAFPLHPNIASLSHDIDAFPFIFLLVSKFFNTFIALWNPREKPHPILFQGGFLAAMLWPYLALAWSAIVDYPPTLQHGIIWASIVGSFSTTISFRAREILALFMNQGKERQEMIVTVPGGGLSMSVVLLSAIFCIVWTLLAIILQTTSLDSDVLLPVVGLLLLAVDPRCLPVDYSPIRLTFGLNCFCWYASAGYHIFARGYSQDSLSIPPPVSIFGWDEDISIWTCESKYLPWLNLFLTLLPLPALYFSTHHNRVVSEEMLVVVAVVSAASSIGASIDCIRYLGIVGVGSAIWRTYELKKLQQRSNSVI